MNNRPTPSGTENTEKKLDTLSTKNGVQGRMSVEPKKIIVCIKCNERFRIWTCFTDSKDHCGKYEGHEHTHIKCECQALIFKGAVTFRTFFNEPRTVDKWYMDEEK